MSEKEKLFFIEEIMDVDEGTLSMDMALTDIVEWDSLSVLTLIHEANSQFGVNLTTSDLKKFVTIEDIVHAVFVD